MDQSNETITRASKNANQFIPYIEETSEAFLTRITKKFREYFMEVSSQAALETYQKTTRFSHMSWEQWYKTVGKDAYDSPRTIQERYRKMIKMARMGQVDYLADSAKKYNIKFTEGISRIVIKLGLMEANISPITMAEVYERGEEIKLVIVQLEKTISIILRVVTRHDSSCYLYVRYHLDGKEKKLEEEQ